MEDKLPILQQRKIEAKVLKKVYDVLLRDHGREIAVATIRDAVMESAIEQGEFFRDYVGHMPDLEDFFHILNQFWTAEDALRIEVIERSPTRLDFNVTRCRYAEMYREMGMAELGGLLSCNRDGVFCAGFNPVIRFSRTQTIMEGASHCDFRYMLPLADSEE